MLGAWSIQQQLSRKSPQDWEFTRWRYSGERWMSIMTLHYMWVSLVPMYHCLEYRRATLTILRFQHKNHQDILLTQGQITSSNKLLLSLLLIRLFSSQSSSSILLSPPSLRSSWLRSTPVYMHYLCTEWQTKMSSCAAILGSSCGISNIDMYEFSAN